MRPTVAEDIRVASSSFARAEVLRTFAQANRGTNQSLSRGSLGSSWHFRPGGQMIGQFLRGGECLVGIHGIWLLAFRADICAILCPVVFFECTSNKYIPRVYLVGICTKDLHKCVYTSSLPRMKFLFCLATQHFRLVTAARRG